MGYLFRNATAYNALNFEQVDSEGNIYGIAIVKRSLFFFGDRPIDMAVSEDICLADEYHGNPNSSSIARPSDISPMKPFGDFIIIGNAYSSTERTSWEASLKFGDFIDKKIKIYGERYWKPIWEKKSTLALIWDDREREVFKGWKLSEPKPTNSVPLVYENAWGGAHPNPDDDLGVYAYNPIGCGWLNDEHTDKTQKYKAPQIEDINNPIHDPFEEYKTQGFAPISPMWKQRAQYAGSYDEEWEKNQSPFLPMDFDDRFWQIAPEDQQFNKEQAYGHSAYIQGINEKGIIDFKIPETRLALISIDHENKRLEIPMHPDTIIYDNHTKRVHILYKTRFDIDNLKLCEIIAHRRKT